MSHPATRVAKSLSRLLLVANFWLPVSTFAANVVSTSNRISNRTSSPTVRRAPASANSASKPTPSTDSEELLRAKLKANSSDSASRVKLTQLLEKKKAWKEIISLNEGYVSTLPRAGLMPIAKAYEMQNDNLNEMRIIKLCLAKDVNDFYCKTAEAQVLVRMKHNDEAIESYNAAKNMNPNFEPAYTGLMKQLEISGYNYEARDLLADMKKHFGDKASYKSDLCRLYSKDAFLEKTYEACNDAIASDRQNPLNFVYLSTSLIEREEVDKAIAVLKKGLKKFPKGVPILIALAKTEMDQKKFPEASRDYKSAVTYDPKSVEAWIGSGKALLELQKFEESLGAFDKACGIDKKSVGEFRTASKRLKDLKAVKWEIQFEDHIYKCAPVY